MQAIMNDMIAILLQGFLFFVVFAVIVFCRFLDTFLR